jgi:hypothetical protein
LQDGDDESRIGGCCGHPVTGDGKV